VKILGIVNLGSILFMLISLGPGDGGTGFSTLDNLFRSIILLWLFFAFQGLLVFVKRLGKWDLVLASMIVVLSISSWIIFDETQFLIATAPMALYLLLQFKRDSFSDNVKLTYLNIWNIIILVFVLFEVIT